MENHHKKLNAGWNFDNSYEHLSEVFFTKQHPEPVKSPALVVFNDALAASLGLESDALKSGEGVAVFAGNKIPTGASPLSQAYAGHQFGGFTMLGDGRAVMLGEHLTPEGERFDIQLKGSGRTVYSRGGDGRATLGPMLREYIISEAMHALGIPTSRSLAVVTTGERVMRETELAGAILTRVSSSHIRVGTFEYIATYGEEDQLKELADYTIDRHYPYVKERDNQYLGLLQEVIKHQAKLIAKWQIVGFIHGVMNTDNMVLSGETIDYGPCAFMNTYDPATVFSSIDTQGRYAYGNQPNIGGWNLARFAETLIPLLADDKKEAVKLAQTTLDAYGDIYYEYWLNGMCAKLGIFCESKEDESLVEDLLQLIYDQGADYTNTFRMLTFDQLENDALFKTTAFKKWHKRWQSRLKQQGAYNEEIVERMKENNPAVIPRNHRVEEALEAAVEKGDYSVMDRLMNVLAKPYAHTEDQEPYTEPPPPTNIPYQTFCGT